MLLVALTQQLKLVSNLIENLTDKQYVHPIKHLGNSSIGGHTRHIIELMQCLNTGYSTGIVDYTNRKRDMRLELSRTAALQSLQVLEMDFKYADKTLELAAESISGNTEIKVLTSYYREIVYNTEHTIHHLALIKAALIELELNFVDESFGMAYSTLKYKASLIEQNQTN